MWAKDVAMRALTYDKVDAANWLEILAELFVEATEINYVPYCVNLRRAQ
jgi:hypothetical protein